MEKQESLGFFSGERSWHFGFTNWFCLIGILLIFASSHSFAKKDDAFIPYETFRLKNGLTVIVHEDKLSPVVGVTLWYHVGSKNETPGKTGLAHLSEHLMFNGSDHFADEYFKPLENVGAIDINGATSVDRTAYYQTVPVFALDLALWMESERMGHFVGALSQKKLDEQRRVVLNEMQQDENRPYHKAKKILLEQSFPRDHPYSWPIIGSSRDINDLNLTDVKKWFQSFYGAANATLVLAGNIDVDTAREKVEKYFAHIPSGPSVKKQKQWIAKRQHVKRVVAYDHVPQPRLYMQWNIPPMGTVDSDLLKLVSQALGGGRTSRLYQRLVNEDGVATAVKVRARPQEISGTFQIVIDVQPGVDLRIIERSVIDELKQFVRVGPSHSELQRVKRTAINQFIRYFESVGGRYGKSYFLARGQVYLNNPGYYQKKISHWQDASAKQLKQVTNNWLLNGAVILDYLPMESRSVMASTVDRRKGPPIVPVSLAENQFRLPEPKEMTLSNGLKVLIVPQSNKGREHALVEMQLQFDAGFAADPLKQRGLAAFSLDMYQEGTIIFDGSELSEKLEALGAKMETSTKADASKISVSVLASHSREALNLLANLVSQPGFRAKAIKQKQKYWSALLSKESADPKALSRRLMPVLLFGDDHPYGSALSGLGSDKAVSQFTREDIVHFAHQWFRPDNATLILVGEFNQEILPFQLERSFGRWVVKDQKLKKKQTTKKIRRKKQHTFYLVDKPGASQTYIFAARLLPMPKMPYSPLNHRELKAVNDIFGGSFTSRINLNLREEKGWSYGVRSRLINYRNHSMFSIRAPVQTDQTAASIEEIIKELNLYQGEMLPSESELQALKRKDIHRIPGRFEKLSSVMKHVSRQLALGRLDQRALNFQQDLENISLEGLHRMLKKNFRSDGLTWLVIGDLKAIEQPVKALSLGDVYILKNVEL